MFPNIITNQYENLYHFVILLISMLDNKGQIIKMSSINC